MNRRFAQLIAVALFTGAVFTPVSGALIQCVMPCASQNAPISCCMNHDAAGMNDANNEIAIPSCCEQMQEAENSSKAPAVLLSPFAFTYPEVHREPVSIGDQPGTRISPITDETPRAPPIGQIKSRAPPSFS